MGKGTPDKSLSKMLKSELLEVAKSLGLTKLSGLRKDELVDLVDKAKRRLRKRKTTAVVTAAKGKTTKAKTTKTAKATKKTTATKAKATKAKTTKAKTTKAKTAKTTEAKTTEAKTAKAKTAKTKTAKAKTAKAKTAKTKTAKAKTAKTKATKAKVTKAKVKTAKAKDRKPAKKAAKTASTEAAAKRTSSNRKRTTSTPAGKKALVASRRERPSKQKAADKAVRVRPSRSQITVDVQAPDTSALPEIASGENRIALMPRDPSWMYAYWNLLEEYKVAARDAGGRVLALRVYDVTEATFDGHNVHVEHVCEEWATNWYIPVTTPGKTYLVEIGYRGDQQWYPLARSNRVQVPRDQPSPSSDIRFATIDLGGAIPQSSEVIAAAHDAADQPGRYPLPGEPGSRPAVPGSVKGLAGGLGAEAAESIARVPGSAPGSVAQVPGSAPGSVAQVPGSLAQVPGSVPGSVTQVPGSVAGSRMGARVPGSRLSARVVVSPGGGALRTPGQDSAPSRASTKSQQPAKPRLLQTTAELVVEGRAAPGTVVQVAGQKIAVGPDGGFFLRIPLPEGLGDLAIEGKNGPQLEHLHLWFGQMTEA